MIFVINYVVEGHDLRYDVQTIIQVFYPNCNYVLLDSIPVINSESPDNITVLSAFYRGLAVARLFYNGKLKDEFSIDFEKSTSTQKEQKRAVKVTIYNLLSKETGFEFKWGTLTGIRPTKVINKLINEGKSKEYCIDYLVNGYYVNMEKARLTYEVAKNERNILDNFNENDISIYIGIPFCPSKCLYCSFTSYSLKQYTHKVDDYLNALFKEIQFISDFLDYNKENNREINLKSIYIGGGTPTSLNEKQLETLLSKINTLLVKNKKDFEYTLEAGRVDTITKEKLVIMKNYNVNRISINPQTMNDNTLEKIGRNHNVDDVKKIFTLAREVGHNNINMDIILGLPNENILDVTNTIEEIGKLAPESITVHTLAVKRASRLKTENNDLDFMDTLADFNEMEEMLEIAYKGACNMEMIPYYMYRQKNMLGNFENIGYCKKGYECIYNVSIMEEENTIIALGSGGSSKIIGSNNKDNFSRVFNIKGVEEYILRIDEMIKRKEIALKDF